MDFPIIATAIAAGGVGFLIGAIVRGHFFDSYLVNKADPRNRTPFYLRGVFYYIVPEHEYVQTQSSNQATE